MDYVLLGPPLHPRLPSAAPQKSVLEGKKMVASTKRDLSHLTVKAHPPLFPISHLKGLCGQLRRRYTLHLSESTTSPTNKPGKQIAQWDDIPKWSNKKYCPLLEKLQ